MKESMLNTKVTILVEGLGEITATASAFNNISFAFGELSRVNKGRGYNISADLRDRQSKQIYRALDSIGFYGA